MDTPPPSPSLWERLRERRGEAPPLADRRVALAIALLLASGPALTIVGAKGLAMRAEDQAALIARQATLAPPPADPRHALMLLIRRPGAAATLEALARVLPTDASLQRAERDADRCLSVDILTTDPDRLRSALRRDPVTATLRDAGQRSADGGIVVTLEEAR